MRKQTPSKFLVDKTLGNHPLGRPRRKGAKNIMMDLRDVVGGSSSASCLMAGCFQPSGSIARLLVS
jgi:C-terminal processing protease CtpA/Prc